MTLKPIEEYTKEDVLDELVAAQKRRDQAEDEVNDLIVMSWLLGWTHDQIAKRLYLSRSAITLRLKSRRIL